MICMQDTEQSSLLVIRLKGHWFKSLVEWDFFFICIQVFMQILICWIVISENWVLCELEKYTATISENNVIVTCCSQKHTHAYTDY